MSLIPSLLTAIIRVDGEALVMHAGDKPYVVTPDGQVDLASRGLTLDAVNGIVSQLLPIEVLRALDEFGAAQYEMPSRTDFPQEHFTVVAARGGDDVWTEIRRRRIPEEDRVPEELFGPAPTAVNAIGSAPAPSSSAAAGDAVAAAPAASSAPQDVDESLALPEAGQLWQQTHAAAAAPIEPSPGAAALIALVAPSAPARLTSITPLAATPETFEAAPAAFATETETPPAAAEAPSLEAAPMEHAAAIHADAIAAPVEAAPIEPAVSEASAIEAAASEPVASEPVAIEAVASDAIAGESAAIESEPAAMETAGSQPIPRTTWEPQPVEAFAPPLEALESPVAESEWTDLDVMASESISSEAIEPDIESVQIAAETQAVEILAQTPLEMAAQTEPDDMVAQAELVEMVAQTEPVEMKAQTESDEMVAQAEPIEVAAQAESLETAAPVEPLEIAAEALPPVEPEAPAPIAAEVEAVPTKPLELVAEVFESDIDEVELAYLEAEAAQREPMEAAASESGWMELVAMETDGFEPDTIEPAVSYAEWMALQNAEPQLEAEPEELAGLHPPTMDPVATEPAGMAASVAAPAPMQPAATERVAAEPIPMQPAAAIPPPIEPPVREVYAGPAPKAPSPHAIQPAPPQPAVVLPMSRNPIRADVPARPAGEMPSGLDRLLQLAAARGAATVYLSSDARPSVRVDGELQALEGEPVLTPKDVESLLLTLMPERSHEALRTGAATEWISDLEEIGRIRCMTFRDQRGPGCVFRLMPNRPVSIEQLALSPEIQALASEPEGLVLVVGPRGSGKRTLMSGFIDLINRSRRDHVISIESEIRTVHGRGTSFISQREVRGGNDETLAAARAALREDPDVLVIDDLRTSELVDVALEAAAAGHLVIAGFPAHDAAESINRIIDLYAPEERRRIQLDLAEQVRGVVGQVLLRKVGGGRVAARELLLNTPAVSSVIAEGNTSQLPMAIEGGRRRGMVPLNDSLARFVQAGVVDGREAYTRAPDRAGFLALLKRQGVDTSAIERLA
jgi:twitching motility protein PilT